MLGGSVVEHRAFIFTRPDHLLGSQIIEEKNAAFVVTSVYD